MSNFHGPNHPCPSCGHRFSSRRAFEHHQSGPVDYLGGQRRCYDPAVTGRHRKRIVSATSVGVRVHRGADPHIVIWTLWNE